MIVSVRSAVLWKGQNMSAARWTPCQCHCLSVLSWSYALWCKSGIPPMGADLNSDPPSHALHVWWVCNAFGGRFRPIHLAIFKLDGAASDSNESRYASKAAAHPWRQMANVPNDGLAPAQSAIVKVQVKQRTNQWWWYGIIYNKI